MSDDGQLAAHREAQKKYRESDKGKAWKAARRDSGEIAKYQKRWRKENKKHAQAYQRERSKRFYAKRKEFINSLKLERGCVDCGYNKHPHALHFDHIANQKHFEISRSFSKSMATLLNEIAKCEVRCANCHAVKTAERRK